MVALCLRLTFEVVKTCMRFHGSNRPSDERSSLASGLSSSIKAIPFFN